jgi:hypothetical protein
MPAGELLIAVNPGEDSRLPYLLRIPVAGGDLLFRTAGKWPLTKALYCYPVPLDMRRGCERQSQTRTVVVSGVIGDPGAIPLTRTW